MKNHKSNLYIPSLNGLRALSILIVILSHINFRLLGQIKIPFPFALFTDGNLGVNVFFVISSFLITKLLLKEETENGTINLKKFYLRRVFRIFPAYYFLLFIYFILQLCKVLYFTNSSWYSSLFYYKYFSIDDWESAHFWSLSIEEHFYLIWPFAFIFFKKSRLHFAFIIIALVFLFRLNSYYKWLDYPILYGYFSVFLRADALMIGCLFALCEKKIVLLALKYRKTFFNPIILLTFLMVLNSNFLPQLNIDHKLHLGFLIIPLSIGDSGGTLSLVVLGMLMIGFINYKGIWFNFLNSPIMNYLGKLSFSLYLWQQLFFSYHIEIFGKLPFNLICAFAAANISYFLIEKPFLKYKMKYAANKLNNLSINTKTDALN